MTLRARGSLTSSVLVTGNVNHRCTRRRVTTIWSAGRQCKLPPQISSCFTILSTKTRHLKRTVIELLFLGGPSLLPRPFQWEGYSPLHTTSSPPQLRLLGGPRLNFSQIYTYACYTSCLPFVKTFKIKISCYKIRD